MRHLPAYAELLRRDDAPPGSSWGLFGPDDQVGTLNFLDAAAVRHAAGLIGRGVVFNLDHHLMAFDPCLSPHRRVPKHTIFQQSDHHRDDHIDGLFLQGSSQIDGLRHFKHPEYGFYNGVPDERVNLDCPDLGINRYAEKGIAGRGVLLDLDRYLVSRGRSLDHARGEAFSADVLDEVAAFQKADLRSGDIVMIRTGFLKWYFEEAGEDDRAQLQTVLCSPGLEQSERSLAWLWDNQVSVCASDNVAIEAMPTVAGRAALDSGGGGHSLYEGLMHPSMIALLGLCLGELWDLEALAADSAADGVYESFVTIKPLNLRGGVGSPANAMAIK